MKSANNVQFENSNAYAAVLNPQYYYKYFTNELFDLGARETNQYYMQTHGTPLTREELKTFFGICSTIPGCIIIGQ